MKHIDISKIEIYDHLGRVVQKYSCKGMLIDDESDTVIVTLKDPIEIRDIPKPSKILKFKRKEVFKANPLKDPQNNICTICGNEIPKLNLLCPTCEGFEPWE